MQSQIAIINIKLPGYYWIIYCPNPLFDGDKAKSNQGGATDHKFLMKLHKITVFEVCVTSWIQRYFENYRFVVWPHISSQANNKHKHHHHQNIHWLIYMKLAVLTYCDRNDVVDTSFASLAKYLFTFWCSLYLTFKRPIFSPWELHLCTQSFQVIHSMHPV